MRRLRSPTSRWVLALLCLALVVRIGTIAANPIDTLTGDAADYDRHAASIAESGQYPESTFVRGGGASAVRPPAYPLALAAVYKLTGTTDPGRREVAGRLLGALLGVVTVGLIGLVAYMLWNRRAALWSMAAASVYPTLAAVGDSLLSEALFTPVVVAAVAAILAYRRSPAIGWVIAAGALVGIASLTRTNGIVLLIPAVVGVVTCTAVARRSRWTAAAALAAAALVVMAPWIVRNAAVLDKPVISTQTGFTLEGTYNDASRNDDVNPAAWRPALIPPYAEVLARRDLDEGETDARLRSLVAGYIGDHPGYVAKVVAYNGLRMLEVIGHEREYVGAQETGVGKTFSDLGRVAFWAALLLAIVALFVARAPLRRVPLFVWLVPAVLLISMLPVNSSARYREPADPFLLLVVGIALAVLAERLAARRGAPPAAT